MGDVEQALRVTQSLLTLLWLIAILIELRHRKKFTEHWTAIAQRMERAAHAARARGAAKSN